MELVFHMALRDYAREVSGYVPLDSPLGTEDVDSGEQGGNTTNQTLVVMLRSSTLPLRHGIESRPFKIGVLLISEVN